MDAIGQAPTHTIDAYTGADAKRGDEHQNMKLVHRASPRTNSRTVPARDRFDSAIAAKPLDSARRLHKHGTPTVLNTHSKLPIARLASRLLLAARSVCGFGGTTEVNRGGLRWALNLREGFVLAIYLGVYETETVKLRSKRPPAGAVAADIGAYIGALSLPLVLELAPYILDERRLPNDAQALRAWIAYGSGLNIIGEAA